MTPQHFSKITQFITWPFIFVLFKLFFSIKITGRENFKKVKGPFMIIANHIRFYDSFIFRLALGFNTPHLPLRFMAVRKFSWGFLNFLRIIGVVPLVYFLFGAFTITQGKGVEMGTREARKTLRNGGNLVIYPEGRIYHGNGEVGGFRPGAAFIIKETGVPVVPVSFRIIFDGKVRGDLYVNVGEPIGISEDLTIEDMSDMFRSSVQELYKKV